jgi:predicted amidohydrolase
MIKRSIALVQFDAIPEEKSTNLAQMERLSRKAAAAGARWIVFHEATLTDYTPRLAQFAERVPSGRATAYMSDLARELDCFISFGLSEVDKDRYFIAQVFVGPQGYIYHYRKTWLCKKETDEGYRNEWERYDPGTGPELFDLDGVEATCFICSDSAAPRCIQRASLLNPQVVFHPCNVRFGVKAESFAARSRAIHAPLLLTNRVGLSWTHESPGGCAFISAAGEILAKANMEGKEEILLYELEIPDAIPRAPSTGAAA